MAGPVVAAAVIFTPETFIKGVNDSKRVLPDRREDLFGRIRDTALAFGIGLASASEIDELNIFWATMAASERALLAMGRTPDHVLVDGRLIPELKLPQTKIVGGDRKSFCIAAASIIAKVTRDRIMAEYEAEFPGYGFAQHKGYCTADCRGSALTHPRCPRRRPGFPRRTPEERAGLSAAPARPTTARGDSRLFVQTATSR
jgi:ribonuclease HII